MCKTTIVLRPWHRIKPTAAIKENIMKSVTTSSLSNPRDHEPLSITPLRAQHISKCCSTVQKRTFWNRSPGTTGKYQTKRGPAFDNRSNEFHASPCSAHLKTPLLCSVRLFPELFFKLSSFLCSFKVQTVVAKNSRNNFKLFLSQAEEQIRGKWTSDQSKRVKLRACASSPGCLEPPISASPHPAISGSLWCFKEKMERLFTKIRCGVEYECPSSCHTWMFPC